MNQDTFNLNSKVYSNNNNLLFGIINDLQQVINNTNDNLIIKRISDIITKMNFIINENKKTSELIINHISLIHKQIDQMNKKFDDGKYIGQVVNGLKEGKGIMYWNDGDRYEGEWRNHKKEGKGIYYFNNGDRMMGDYYNGKAIGKHVMLTKNGDVKIENY